MADEAKIGKQWHEAARGRAPGDAARISRMHRYSGCVCSRAAWLGLVWSPASPYPVITPLDERLPIFGVQDGKAFALCRDKLERSERG